MIHGQRNEINEIAHALPAVSGLVSRWLGCFGVGSANLTLARIIDTADKQLLAPETSAKNNSRNNIIPSHNNKQSERQSK